MTELNLWELHHCEVSANINARATRTVSSFINPSRSRVEDPTDFKNSSVSLFTKSRVIFSIGRETMFKERDPVYLIETRKNRRKREFHWNRLHLKKRKDYILFRYSALLGQRETQQEQKQMHVLTTLTNE